MGSVRYQGFHEAVHEFFRGDQEREHEGYEGELSPDRYQALALEEQFITDHCRPETYGLRMLMRSI